MFPFRDDNPTLSTSFATFFLITLNILAWILVQGAGFQPGLTESVWKFGLIPAELLRTLPAGTSVPAGEHMSYIIGENPRFVTLLTSMFMHGSWLHLLGNMWFMYLFGDNVEDAIGPFKFIVFYLFCGACAALLQMALSPSSAIPMVGASGAISGVMGAYALLYPRASVHMLVFLGFYVGRVVVPAYLMLGYWFFLQFLSGLVATGGPAEGGVAVWAHIGGFVAGITTVWFFCRKDRLEACRSKRIFTNHLIQRYRKFPE
jgi:membrane associated rhomboid family serine protease